MTTKERLYYNQAAILCSLLQNIKVNNLQFAGLIILLDLRMINSPFMRVAELQSKYIVPVIW